MWLIIFLSTIIGLGVVIGFLIKALAIQVKKNSIHEQWIIDIQNKVENVYETIVKLDEKQMFSKDDEVGDVFQQMVKIIESLSDITSKE